MTEARSSVFGPAAALFTGEGSSGVEFCGIEQRRHQPLPALHGIRELFNPSASIARHRSRVAQQVTVDLQHREPVARIVRQVVCPAIARCFSGVLQVWPTGSEWLSSCCCNAAVIMQSPNLQPRQGPCGFLAGRFPAKRAVVRVDSFVNQGERRRISTVLVLSYGWQLIRFSFAPTLPLSRGVPNWSSSPNLTNSGHLTGTDVPRNRYQRHSPVPN